MKEFLTQTILGIILLGAIGSIGAVIVIKFISLIWDKYSNTRRAILSKELKEAEEDKKIINYLKTTSNPELIIFYTHVIIRFLFIALIILVLFITLIYALTSNIFSFFQVMIIVPPTFIFIVYCFYRLLKTATFILDDYKDLLTRYKKIIEKDELDKLNRELPDSL